MPATSEGERFTAFWTRLVRPHTHEPNTKRSPRDLKRFLARMDTALAFFRPPEILEGGKEALFHLNLCTGSGSFYSVLLHKHDLWKFCFVVFDPCVSTSTSSTQNDLRAI